MAAKLADSSSLEQRAVIRFLLAEDVKTSDILSRMQKQYGDSCMSKANVYRWAQTFKEGRKTLTDEPRSGRPSEAKTPELIKMAENMILSDRRVLVDDIAKELEISHGSAWSIVRDDLAYSKVSCRWVPKMLTEDHKTQRLMASRSGLRRFRQDGEAFLSRIVTTDETWVHHYEPESKRQSMEWKHVQSPTKKKFKSQRAVGKVMLTVFWDMKGPVTIDFLQRGTTVNAENYCELLGKVKDDIRSRRRGLLSRGVILLQDNARPHTAARTLAQIDDMGWELLTHPPYSPDLAPSDYHLFGPLKEHLRGKHFRNDEEVMQASREWLLSQPQEFYAEGIQKLTRRWQTCIDKSGDYVEK